MSTVLIVDDSATAREMLSSILQNVGMKVIEARDGVEAQQKISDNPPDIVVLDIIMPRMNGYDLCRWLKKTPNGHNIPVLMCSSKAEQFDRYWGIKQGADAYLAKPFHPSELIETVKSLLRSLA
ncbi:response regulator transcription factor [Oscillatoria acuminata]|uniref:Response regulator with CheY-like receiver domain and winged-helix DNA-binding domain n=1 Tax=Oscillatoria acuminata PCC 6304 TaxID=56110 RepID=K9TD95_9CYAN|nr:response regulator [Oscillatoria acuminata]AFY80510.1 response regulator with CheY-like receiver domain and winged-helix DNA-binding domain [Oscillatoria acuminata PCC 6304]